MSKKDLSNKPKDLKPEISKHTLPISKADAWFYEEAPGLLVITQIQSGDKVSYVHIPIPWRTLLASVKRYTKK